ncbi:MAG: hypothetical protein SGI92_26510 [Bryobacteraceae bacterium]|nr:hypothetical protein [Bryobacteraceae bacterium]
MSSIYQDNRYGTSVNDSGKATVTRYNSNDATCYCGVYSGGTVETIGGIGAKTASGAGFDGDPREFCRFYAWCRLLRAYGWHQ